MGLATILETLDGVDDAVKEFYAEHDGKHVLQLDGIDDHPEVAGLKSAFTKTKAERDADKAALAKAKADLAAAIKDKPDQAALLKAQKDYEDTIATITGERDTALTRLMGVTRDRTLEDALTSAGIANPTFRKAAIAMLAPQVKMDGDRAVVETGMGPKDVAVFVKEWAAKDGKDFVTPPQGGGAKGKDGVTAGKTMTNAAFNLLSPKEKSAAMDAGTTLTD